MTRPSILSVLYAVTLFWLLLQAQSAESKSCSNPLPGLRKMISGVDITTLDLLPIEPTGMTSDDGFKRPVLAINCNSVTRSSPGPYDEPDLVSTFRSLPTGLVSSSATLYKSYSDVRESMTSNIKGDSSLPILKFALSSSKSYKKMQETIMESSRYISEVHAIQTTMEILLRKSEYLQLHPDMKLDIDGHLTGTFDTNPEQYLKFIGDYGTHYFSSAIFGGVIKDVIEINTDYFYSRNDREVQTSARAAFENIISGLSDTSSSSSHVDATFTKESSQTINYLGGQTNLLTPNGISLWQPTIEQDPWLINGVLVPISELITNQTKKRSMVQAATYHVLMSYLDELERLVGWAMTKSGDAKLNTLRDRISTMKGQTNLQENDVEKLGQDVERELLVPDWFMTKTELCYQWRQDGDSGQCGGGAANLLCAKLNAMTPYYRDDTDHRRGGCRMQWGIKVGEVVRDSWFRDIQVCYRWYPDGDSGQCSGSSRTLCAGINQFSPEYRDDTDRRGGGCQMSWKFQVPSTAPLWLRSTKMCFEWRADGDSAQCGGVSSKKVCAVANQWTAYYRDDTDRRGGGCNLRWGFQLDF